MRETSPSIKKGGVGSNHRMFAAACILLNWGHPPRNGSPTARTKGGREDSSERKGTLTNKTTAMSPHQLSQTSMSRAKTAIRSPSIEGKSTYEKTFLFTLRNPICSLINEGDGGRFFAGKGGSTYGFDGELRSVAQRGTIAPTACASCRGSLTLGEDLAYGRKEGCLKEKPFLWERKVSLTGSRTMVSGKEVEKFRSPGCLGNPSEKNIMVAVGDHRDLGRLSSGNKIETSSKVMVHGLSQRKK